MDASPPWGTLFGLLFMTMGPIRAVAVFANFGTGDDAPGVRALAARAVALVAIAFAVAVVLGNQTLTRLGVGLPALIAAVKRSIPIIQSGDIDTFVEAS